jgi:hypothetical protein
VPWRGLPLRSKTTVAILLAFALAGCLEQGQLPNAKGADGVLGLVAGPALWNDPQNAPHPAYNYPTLANPPVGPDVPAWWMPIPAAELPAHISGLKHVTQVKGVDAGAGIAIFGRLAVVPEDAKKAYVVDIGDPTNPTVLSTFETDGRGAAMIPYPDGRLITVLAGTKTITVADITDPTNPVVLGPITPTQGSHKLGVVPGTPIVYNAASVGGVDSTPLYGPGPSQLSPDYGNGVTEIFDLTDPENPVHVQDWKNGYSCHHVFFWNNPAQDRYRAICAGMEYTQIWDTKDPLHPSVIVSVPVHHGVANGPSTMASVEMFSHSAGFNAKGNILYVGDENGGGGLPPGCVASASTPAGAVSTPVGATWFYDISNEKNPRLLGYYSPSQDPRVAVPMRSCTTHHGRIVPDPQGRDLLAMSYYQDGVVLVDFTGIDFAKGKLPMVVDQFAQGSDTWETWYYNGYLFTGDLARGMDVIQFR